jgi:hypothetical protein
MWKKNIFLNGFFLTALFYIICVPISYWVLINPFQEGFVIINIFIILNLSNKGTF